MPLVDFLVLLGHLPPVPHKTWNGRVAAQLLLDRVGPSLDRIGQPQHRASRGGDLGGGTARIGHHNRNACGHRFRDDHAIGLSDGRMEQDIETGVIRVLQPPHQRIAALPVREQMLHLGCRRPMHPECQLRTALTQSGHDGSRKRQALAPPFLADKGDHAPIAGHAARFALHSAGDARLDGPGELVRELGVVVRQLLPTDLRHRDNKFRHGQLTPFHEQLHHDAPRQPATPVLLKNRGEWLAVVSGDVMATQALMAVNQPAGMRIGVQPGLHSFLEIGERLPTPMRRRPAQLVNHHALWRFERGCLAQDFDLMPQQKQLAGRFPDVALHAPHRTKATHHVDKFHTAQKLSKPRLSWC